ncbi:hypothetical protein KUTeg_013780 [Tegillarca granosa]|uniref:Cyclic nucleotide-binding domain-containing protein n=1 Tax=Tegillarca granosa TaxID=220873 RepID=A0ABQ9EY73_TEGGR|nr:hypothetical protein KUTeg_013780 [Tegillarca granosa]
MLTGKTSIYIDTTKTDEDPPIEKTESEETKIVIVNKDNEEQDEEIEADKKDKKPIDRSKYGKFMVHYEAGKSFGEVALIREDSVRNATVIADEETDLLAKEEEEYAERKDFIQNSPLFCKWSLKFKRLLEPSIRKEVYPYGSTIVRQGQPVVGLVFVLSGQAKITVEPSMHSQQYPLLMKQNLNPIAKEIGRDFHKVAKKEARDVTQQQIRVRRKEGYAAAEKLMINKTMDLCCIQENDVIGDVEMVMDMETNMYTVTSVANTTVMILDTKSYDRLIAKKNQQTVNLICKKALQKTLSRVHTQKGHHVPLLPLVAQKLEAKLPRKVVSNTVREAIDKENNEKLKLFEQLLEFFVKGKVPLIQPFVPDSLYYRKKSEKREKMMEHHREQTRKESGKLEADEQVNFFRPHKKIARSMKQLKKFRAENDLLSSSLPQKSFIARPRTALGVRGEMSWKSNSTFRPMSSNELTSSSKGIFHLTECNVKNHNNKEELFDQIDSIQRAKSESRSKVVCSVAAREQLQQTTNEVNLANIIDDEYFDWETSEKNLRNLEERIKQFCDKTNDEEAWRPPSNISSLKPFSIKENTLKMEETSFDIKVPKPGGTVFIKAKPCHFPRNIPVDSTIHQHVHRYIVSRDNSRSMAIDRPKSAHISVVQRGPIIVTRPKTAMTPRATELYT